MLIRIRHSKLFMIDPSKRFAFEYSVPETLWIELWRKYKILDFPINDLVDLYQIRTKRNISKRAVKRWIFLTEIYMLTKPAREKGVEVINTELFGKLEPRVVDEITRGMKSSGTRDSRIMA